MEAKSQVRLPIVLAALVVALTGYMVVVLMGPIELPWQGLAATIVNESAIGQVLRRRLAKASTVWGSQQPKHITDLIGAEGEHLAGPQVYVDSPGDAKQIRVTVSVTVPPSDT